MSTVGNKTKPRNTHNVRWSVKKFWQTILNSSHLVGIVRAKKLHTSSFSGRSGSAVHASFGSPPPPPKGGTFAFHRFCGSILCFTNAWLNFWGSPWNDLIWRWIEWYYWKAFFGKDTKVVIVGANVNSLILYGTALMPYPTNWPLTLTTTIMKDWNFTPMSFSCLSKLRDYHSLVPLL